jgi:hypothetical protein
MITSSASTGSSRTWVAWPSPSDTTAKEPRSSSARNAATAASTESGSAAVHSASVCVAGLVHADEPGHLAS